MGDSFSSVDKFKIQLKKKNIVLKIIIVQLYTRTSQDYQLVYEKNYQHNI